MINKATSRFSTRRLMSCDDCPTCEQASHHVLQHRLLGHLQAMHRNDQHHEHHIAAYYAYRQEFHLACFTTLIDHGEHNH